MCVKVLVQVTAIQLVKLMDTLEWVQNSLLYTSKDMHTYMHARTHARKPWITSVMLWNGRVASWMRSRQIYNCMVLFCQHGPNFLMFPAVHRI